MRQWNINPKIMCKRHLLGEHLEIHMFVGCIKKGKNIKGYVDKGLVEFHSLLTRHDELVKELESRGVRHNTPLDYKPMIALGYVNAGENKKILKERCEECRRLQDEEAKKEIKGLENNQSLEG